MFCIKCGAKLPDGAKFCSNCGARLESKVPAAAPAPAPEEKPVPETVETAARTPELSQVIETAAEAAETAAKAVDTVAEAVDAAEAPEATAKESEEKPEEAPDGDDDVKVSTLPASEKVFVAPAPAPAPEPAPEPMPGPVFRPAPGPAPAPERAEVRAAAGVAAPAYSARPAQTYTPPATQIYTGQPQPTPEPVHTPEQGKGKKEKAPKPPKAPAKSSAGRIILSVFLSILLFVSVLASTLETVVKFKVNPTQLNQFVHELIDEKGAKGVFDMILSSGSKKAARPARTPVLAASLGVAVTNAPHVASAVSSGDFDLGDIDLSDLENVDELLDQISEQLYDNVKDKAGWEDVRQKDIRNALDDPLVDEFLDQATKDLVDGVLNGEKGKGNGITPEMITDFVVEHKSEIEDLVKDAGYTGELKIDTDKLEDSIRDSIGDGISAESLPEEVTKQIDQVKDIYSTVVSTPVFIGLWALTALLIVLLIVVNRHRISAVLLCVGIPALIVGILFLAAWGALTFVPLMKEEPFNLVSDFLGKYMLLVGAGLAGGGLVFIIVKAIIGTVQKKNRA